MSGSDGRLQREVGASIDFPVVMSDGEDDTGVPVVVCQCMRRALSKNGPLGEHQSARTGLREQRAGAVRVGQGHIRAITGMRVCVSYVQLPWQLLCSVSWRIIALMSHDWFVWRNELARRLFCSHIAISTPQWNDCHRTSHPHKHALKRGARSSFDAPVRHDHVCVADYLPCGVHP
jgi:hypothetical protein